MCVHMHVTGMQHISVLPPTAQHTPSPQVSASDFVERQLGVGLEVGAGIWETKPGP